nr:hypothetical protein [Streptomyces xantholiticus]
MTYDQIQVEPGCSEDSIPPGVRDLPKPTAGYTDIHLAKSADLRRRTEGAWYGIVLGAQ